MKKATLSILLVISSIAVNAQTKLPSFFGDNMVLQQNTEVAVWGTDYPNTKISISASWLEEAQTIANLQGKWKVIIPTPEADNKAYTLKVKGTEEIVFTNVLLGEVWICSGQSNMEMPVKGFPNSPVKGSNEAILNSKNNRIRLFHTKRNTSLTPLNDVSGSWTEASPKTVADFSAVAYFFGKKLNEVTNVPIGLIVSSWGGATAEAWTDAETLSQFKNIMLPTEIPTKSVMHTPTLLFNAMIHPFIGYNIKGAIWYQGESNRTRPEQYKNLLPAMINSWRKKWQLGNFPFYFAQVAPFYYGTGLHSSFITESQLHTMQTLENTGMAITIDLGECDDIHPAEKKIVGDRLAYWALAKDYNIEGFAFSGPVFKSMETTDDHKAIISFDYAERGLTTFKQELTAFQIAGSDSVFYPAKAKINRRKKAVTVWNDNVENPIAVRYAFGNCIDGNLFNVYGLPAPSFRTDNWEK